MQDIGTEIQSNSLVASELSKVKHLVTLAKKGQDILEELRPFLSDDKPIATQAAAVAALRECGDRGFSELLTALGSQNEIVAIMAIRSFESLTIQGYVSPEGLRILTDLVVTASVNVRTEASLAVDNLLNQVLQHALRQEYPEP
jgi:hypothetical protein